MLALKNGVRLIGIRPELTIGIRVVNAAFAESHLDCTITSIVDSKHSRASLHYAGAACDFRTRHLTEDVQRVLYDNIKERLGPDFDFISEPDHFHMEYQPKEPY